jgi:hypothetical protein
MAKDVKKRPGPKPMRPEDRRVQIPVRVKPAIRQKLERLAKYKKRSLSNVIELLLDRKLIDVEWRGNHHLYFGLLMARIGWMVEQKMGRNPPQYELSKGWLNDSFAAQYVRAAVIDVLQELIPDKPTGEIPKELRRTAKQLHPSLSPKQVTYFNSPEGLGRELAREVIDRLRYDRSPFASDEFLEDYNEMANVQDADLFPKIAKALGIKD